MKKPMKRFFARVATELRALLAAIQFLSTLPVPARLPACLRYQEGDFEHAASYYPLVGYLLGGLLLAASLLLSDLPEQVRGVLLLGLWLWLTGMLHFDGVVDSADALLAVKSPQQRLSILKDVHVGAFGLGVGGFVLLLYAATLGSAAPLAPLLAMSLARMAVVWPMSLWRSARASGLGQLARPSWGRRLASLLWLLPWLGLSLWQPAWLALPALLTLILALALVVTLLAAWMARRLGGGLTGDSYGALLVAAELTCLCTLLALYPD